MQAVSITLISPTVTLLALSFICAGVNSAALRLLPAHLLRLMCAALRRGMIMLGDSAIWGVVMEAPSNRQVLPRILPPLPTAADAPLRRALLPTHLVHPAAAGDKTRSETTFRWLLPAWRVCALRLASDCLQPAALQKSGRQSAAEAC
jgi:hypothetical protein